MEIETTAKQGGKLLRLLRAAKDYAECDPEYIGWGGRMLNKEVLNELMGAARDFAKPIQHNNQRCHGKAVDIRES